MTKCPYCGRELREHERYCDFCEQDIGKAIDKEEKPSIIEEFKALFERIKKKFKKNE